ncbi:hypothetical protein C8Q70DRAFT_935472 [Cubamyces menziesii]|uniref:Pyridoxamine 5'-phosphate oxidase N-terminal domain-containing protein n=1 Tax=Trametes cubensis TaxID=1111947 RepID=A0AAD7U324_9APHY|nr:hypothetical protein C8Q70DRAFT_935472 [Cubamyces menziesii]KAJ8495169.1 hypothetical protein ONZ51_g1857 [Trametes cubensis]
MGKFYESIPPELVPWIMKQEVFWVATAPLNPEGHVNVSPKGVRDSLHIVSPTKVWYQDLTGSGVETISHLRENGRITIMFNAYDGPPRICRLFGTGSVHEFGTPEYDKLIPPENRRPGSRAAIVIDVHKVGTSCGYSVPYFEFKGHRQVLLDYFDKRERADQVDPNGHAEKGLKAYWDKENTKSIDGLPGLALAPKVERVPDCRDEMRNAEMPEGGSGTLAKTANGNGTVAATGSGVLLMKHNLRRQRMQDFVVAFALGVTVAAIFVQVVSTL